MKTSKRRQQRITETEGCRNGRRPSPEARARYAEVTAQATLRRMFPGF